MVVRMVSVLTFYSDDLSSIPAGVNCFLYKLLRPCVNVLKSFLFIEIRSVTHVGKGYKVR